MTTRDLRRPTAVAPIVIGAANDGRGVGTPPEETSQRHRVVASGVVAATIHLYRRRRGREESSG